MRLCEYLDAGDEKWKVVGKKATEKKRYLGLNCVLELEDSDSFL